MLKKCWILNLESTIILNAKAIDEIPTGMAAARSAFHLAIPILDWTSKQSSHLSNYIMHNANIWLQNLATESGGVSDYFWYTEGLPNTSTKKATSIVFRNGTERRFSRVTSAVNQISNGAGY